MRVLLLALGAGALFAAPALAQDARSFDLPDFDRIDVSAGVVLVADVGGPQSIKVETVYGDFSDFAIEVKNGELNLSRKWNRLSWRSKKSDYTVFVSMPALRALDASSGSHAKVSKINAARFNVDLSSGAHATLDGACEDCEVELSSGAFLKARDLTCESAEIDVSSGGHGEITATRSVVADASSGGHVAVYGNPGRVDVDKSSGGRIKILAAAQARRD